MKISKVMGDEKRYIDLLLLADKQEDMIDNYLEKGDMFILDDNGAKAECVMMQEAEYVYELKTLQLQFSVARVWKHT